MLIRTHKSLLNQCLGTCLRFRVYDSDEFLIFCCIASCPVYFSSVSVNHNPFEEKEEPKRYQAEVLLLTSLTAGPSRLTESGMPIYPWNPAENLGNMGDNCVAIMRTTCPAILVAYGSRNYERNMQILSRFCGCYISVISLLYIGYSPLSSRLAALISRVILNE